MSSQSDERLALHVDALMELWRALYPAAAAGDLASIDRFLLIERRVGDLIGLGRADGGSEPGGDEDEDFVVEQRRFARSSQASWDMGRRWVVIASLVRAAARRAAPQSSAPAPRGRCAASEPRLRPSES